MTNYEIPNKLKSGFPTIEQIILSLIMLFTVSNVLHHFTAIRNIALCLSGGFLFFAIKTNRLKLNYYTPLLWPLTLFGAWAFLGLFFSSLDWKENVHDFVSHYLKYILFYVCFINVFTSMKRLNLLLWSIVFFFAAYYLWVMIDYYVILDNPLKVRLGDGSDYRAFAQNIEGFLTITAISFSLMFFTRTENRSLKVLLIFCIGIFMLASFLPQSRGTLLALVISLLVFSFRKKIVFVSLLFCIVLLLTFFDMPSRLNKSDFFKDSARIDIVLFSLQLVKENPVMGKGFNIDLFEEIRLNQSRAYEAYKARAKVKKDYHYREAHNGLLSILVRTGTIGLFLYSWIMLSLIKLSITGIKSEKTYVSDMSFALVAAFSGFFIKCLLEPTFSHRPQTIFYLILGLQSVLWMMENRFTKAT